MSKDSHIDQQRFALVPVSKPNVDTCSSDSGEADFSRSHKTTKPQFLAQLARQYENREEAARRRRETRQSAIQSYKRTPNPIRAKHLIWA